MENGLVRIGETGDAETSDGQSWVPVASLYEDPAAAERHDPDTYVEAPRPLLFDAPSDLPSGRLTGEDG
jgi:hypothetical protein